VYHYPRNKIVMTQPVVLPLVGKARLGEISKEALLRFWQDIIDRMGMQVRFGQRVEQIQPAGNGYLVKTNRDEYRTRNVLLSIGRRGTPRKLGVPGEELPKVVYGLVDAEQYRNQHVLVVGGGDSAIEAAVAVAAEPGTTVTLSYRGDAFNRVKQRSRERLADAQLSGRLKIMVASQVLKIEPQHVHIDHAGEPVQLANDAVIVCVGGILPTDMLRELGIRVDTKFGTA
jgi:thioredoxin reductase